MLDGLHGVDCAHRQHAIHVWLDFSVPSLLARVKDAVQTGKGKLEREGGIRKGGFL